MSTRKTFILSLCAFLLGLSVATILFRGKKELQAAGAVFKPEIILYSQPNFQGRELHLYGDTADLPYEDLADGTQMLWNDSVWSIIVVSGTWRLYQNGRMNTALDDTPLASLDLATKVPMNGWSTVLSARSVGPLMIASPELGGFDSDISSVQLVSQENLPDWACLGK